MTTGILGGGISGLTLHRFLPDSEVLEADTRPGGLCQSFEKDGFRYDIGGHILFSKHKHVNEYVDKILEGNLHRARRNNRVLYGGRYVKYPFENDLATLELQDRYECLIGYLTANYPKPTNLEEWSYYTFGKGISEKYLLPYNRKIWKMEPKEIGLEWVERIPKPPMEDVVKSALGIETEGYTHQLYFRYPLEGGFEALVHRMAEGAMLQCGFRVERIRRDGDGWLVNDRRYERIVVAFPIHEAIRCFEGVPEAVQAAVRGLRYNSMRIGLVAVNNESLMDKTAIYIPDPDVLAHRVCFMGVFSPRNVRPGTSSLLAEITVREGSDLDTLPDDVFMDRLISDLDRVGIIRRADVIVTDTRRIKYAYPVYDIDYSRNVKVLHEYFDGLGVPLLGRFAEYDYINSDECVHRGMQLAEKLTGHPVLA